MRSTSRTPPFPYTTLFRSRNFQPRVGLAWAPFDDDKTVVRAAYALLTDKPMTSVVSPTATNPPLAIPLSFTGTIERKSTRLNSSHLVIPYAVFLLKETRRY